VPACRFVLTILQVSVMSNWTIVLVRKIDPLSLNALASKSNAFLMRLATADAFAKFLFPSKTAFTSSLGVNQCRDPQFRS
jgi:hypothetical protein